MDFHNTTHKDDSSVDDSSDFGDEFLQRLIAKSSMYMLLQMFTTHV